MAYLILIRHGQSEWNAKGLWTGWNDIDLNEKGREEARNAAEKLSDIKIDKAYTSDLKRAQQTLQEIKHKLKLQKLPTIIAPELKERNYGDLAGKNKWKVKEKYGEEQFKKWRRGWDEPIPNGESLKDVYSRVIPYYEKNILPAIKKGENILISAHGNSLRALVKNLDNISDSEISNLEIGTGEVYIYQINEKGKVIFKEIRAVNEDKLKV
jgi:2,3-bisphosphoglycerate-dependent phosphoglycerate mutase